MDKNYFGYDLAGPVRRLLAYVIHVAIATIPVYYINTRYPMYSAELKMQGLFPLINLLILILLGGLLYVFWSGNLGHRIMGIKVISAKDGSDVKNVLLASVRELVKALLSGISVLWYIFNKKDQALQDSLFNTYVVKRK